MDELMNEWCEGYKTSKNKHIMKYMCSMKCLVLFSFGSLWGCKFTQTETFLRTKPGYCTILSVMLVYY